MIALQAYRLLWRIPGAPRLLIAGLVARVGSGITVLAWLLLVKQTTGSYAQAALVSAAMSLATGVAAPMCGRLADHFGARRVLLVSSAIHSATQLVLLAATVGHAPLSTLCALAVVSGAAFPQVSAALRAAWATLTQPGGGHGESRNAAMAAECSMFDLVFVLGPLLVSGFVLLGTPVGTALHVRSGIAGPALALIVAACSTALGTLAVATGGAISNMRPAGARHRTRGLGPLRTAGIGWMVLCAAGMGFSFGAAQVAIVAYAQARHGAAGDSVAGVLFAVWSLGGALAGLWYGSRQFRFGLVRQFAVLLAGLTAGYALWVLMANAVALGVVMFFTGAVIGPALTIEANLVAQLAPPDMRNESYTWLSSTNLSAGAAGVATAGALADQPNAAMWGFLAAACAAAIAAAIAGWPGLLRTPCTATGASINSRGHDRPHGTDNARVTERK